MNQLLHSLEKYGFALALLFCFGFFLPDLTPKEGLLFDDSYSSGGSGAKSNIVKQAFWVAMFLFFCWRFLANHIFEKAQLKQIMGVLALCSMAFVSALWSDFPLLTLKRATFQVLLASVIMVSFYYAVKYNTLERILFYSGILISTLIFVSVLTGAGFNNKWNLTGFLPGKNLLGQNLLVYLVMIILYFKLHQQPSFRLKVLGVLFLLLLFLTGSKTSIILFFIFIFVGYILPAFSRFFVSALFISCLGLFVFIPSLSFYNGEMIHIGQYISPEAITGRGLIWDTLYTDLSYFESVNLGYGYGAYFNTGITPAFFDDPWSFLNRITSTHNGYIDLLMQFGFFGMILISIIITMLFLNIKNYWLSTALLIAAIYNFTEASFFRDYTMMWFLALVIFAYIATPFNRNEHG